MASRKQNLKSLFSNTRTRVIIIFTAVVLLIAILIGYFKLHSVYSSAQLSSAVSSAPGSIQSIPGVLDPTAQYAKLQQQQNVDQAKQAQVTGGSAIPTIIRTQAIGQGVGVIGAQNGTTGGVGFIALSHENEGGTQRSLWIQTLQNANCSKTAVNQVVNQGAQLGDLRAACSCTQLKDDGYALNSLQQVCACKDLKAAGYNARQLKDIGYSAERLRSCGFDACELRNAGFTAQQMKDAGFSDGELKGAGFSNEEIKKAEGLPNGITASDVLRAGCSAEALNKLRQAGVSASAIRRISGCSVQQLKAAGFSAQDLKDAGFSAADLRKAGFTPEQLKNAGYSARDLLNAGFTPAELSNAGYSDAQIKSGEAELPPGITPNDVKESGCDVNQLIKEREAGVSAALIRQYAGCSAKALSAAGFTNADLANAGFTPQQISAADGLSDSAIKAAGCNPDALKKLFAAGVSATRIKELNGCSAQELKDAGYGANALLGAGFSPKQLLAAGFTPNQLESSGVSPADIIAAGRTADCSVAYLKKAKAAGVSASTIEQTLGCSAKALKEAGYTAAELRDAGFTAAELKDAGFNADQLKAAGFSAKELRDAGFTAAELKNAGFSADQLKDAGFSAGQLKDAGFSAAQLKAAGYSASQLKDAGFNAAQLKDAGYSASQLKEAGYSAADLKKAGFSAQALQEAGFSPDNSSSVAGLESPSTSPGVGNDAITALPGIGGTPITNGSAPTKLAANSQQLQSILSKQNEQMAEQKYQQKIQQRTQDMSSNARQLLQGWKQVSTQVYAAGNAEKNGANAGGAAPGLAGAGGAQGSLPQGGGANTTPPAVIKTGDILFAVIDTAVDSDEPGPILATIVSGKYKGTKLIGSFNLPSNANSMVISFNTMSVPGAPKAIPISAYAVDPNTARTALASRTDHHYLMRYGSLFASSFLEGFGNAFQSANTTVTIGGTGGANAVTIQNGVGRSSLENAVIGLATVGKTWGQATQQLFSTPVTVEVYSGTSIGVLFTQDVTSLS